MERRRRHVSDLLGERRPTGRPELRVQVRPTGSRFSCPFVLSFKLKHRSRSTQYSASAQMVQKMCALQVVLHGARRPVAARAVRLRLQQGALPAAEAAVRGPGQLYLVIHCVHFTVFTAHFQVSSPLNYTPLYCTGLLRAPGQSNWRYPTTQSARSKARFARSSFALSFRILSRSHRCCVLCCSHAPAASWRCRTPLERRSHAAFPINSSGEILSLPIITRKLPSRVTQHSVLFVHLRGVHCFKFEAIHIDIDVQYSLCFIM